MKQTILLFAALLLIASCENNTSTNNEKEIPADTLAATSDAQPIEEYDGPDLVDIDKTEIAELQELIKKGAENMKYVNEYSFDIDPQGNVVATNDNTWMYEEDSGAKPTQCTFNLADIGEIKVYDSQEDSERHPGVYLGTFFKEKKIKCSYYNGETGKMETKNLASYSIPVYEMAQTTPIAERICNIINFLIAGDDECVIENLEQALLPQE